MNDPARKNAWKGVLFVAIFLMAAFSVVGGYYRYTGTQEVAPPPPKPSAGRATAVIALDPQSSQAPAPGAPGQAPPHVDTPERTAVRISSRDPLEQFRKDTRTALLQRLAPAFPELPRYLSVEQDDSRDPAYRRYLMQFLDAAEKAQPDQQPAMLLAGDFMAGAVWCPSEAGKLCTDVRNDFAQHKLSLEHSELGSGFYYQHDLLWRLWRDYPNTDWGERAFVLLLDAGWDTSGTCAKGADQFREVIRQGESFLQQHPNSSYRSFVVHLVGQAYATWWALSNQPLPGMEDYVDPKLYQKGAAEARLKAIAYFEQALQLAPGTPLAQYAQEILPALRDQQLTQDGYRFFCVYD